MSEANILSDNKNPVFLILSDFDNFFCDKLNLTFTKLSISYGTTYHIIPVKCEFVMLGLGDPSWSSHDLHIKMMHLFVPL